MCSLYSVFQKIILRLRREVPLQSRPSVAAFFSLQRRTAAARRPGGAEAIYNLVDTLGVPGTTRCCANIRCSPAPMKSSRAEATYNSVDKLG